MKYIIPFDLVGHGMNALAHYSRDRREIREDFKRASGELESSSRAALAEAWRSSTWRDMTPYFKAQERKARQIQLLRHKYRVRKAEALMRFDQAMKATA